MTNSRLQNYNMEVKTDSKSNGKSVFINQRVEAV